MNQPYLSFMLLILEDRAVTSVFDALNLVRKRYGDDPEIDKLVKCIYVKKHNPVKSGEIGKYLHAREQMLTLEDQCKLADVVGEYDDVVKISERNLKKSVRDVASSARPDLDDEDLQIVENILFAMICCTCIKDYYLEVNEHLPNIDIYMGGVLMKGTYFERVVPIFDHIAVSIIHTSMDFISDERFSQAQVHYYNTIQNNYRMIEHYHKLGIKESPKNERRSFVYDLRPKTITNQ